MNSYKKKKIKSLIKEKWYLLAGSGAFLIIGIIALLVGLKMSGWSFIDWLKTPYAFTFIVMVVVGLLLGLLMFLVYKKSKIGGDYNER